MGDQDPFYPNPIRADGMHDWVLSAGRMAKVLADKGYHYQFVFARNSKHVDRPSPKPSRPRSACGRSRMFTARPRHAKLTAPLTSKGGDPVTLTIATLATSALTANRIDPALARYRP
jgi:hypothetical protein